MRSSLFVLALATAALAAPSAAAHGPTVTLRADGPDPASLEIARRETVHFANASEATLRVHGDDDSFRSPPLAPGEGWHLPFPFPGRFGYALESAPDARGEIVVRDE